MAEAIRLHRRYLGAVREWNRWLGTAPPLRPPGPGGLAGMPVSNADQYTLWKLIYELKRRRGPGGEWEHVDEDVIPTATDIAAMLSPRFDQFGAQVNALRVPVEEAAAGLVNFLSSIEFLTEFSALEEPLQWQAMSDLLDGLADSWAGKAYLSASLVSTSPLPMAHPDRILNTSTPLKDLGTDFKTIRNYTKVFLKLGPTWLEDPEFEGKWIYFIQRNFPAAVWENKKNLPDVLASTLRYLPSIDWPWWLTVKGAAAAFTAALEIVTLGYYAKKAVEDPSALNIAKLSKATFNAIKAIGAVSKQAYGETFPLAFADSTKYLLSGPGAALDIYMAAGEVLDSTKAANIGDYSVATGHALAGAGLAIGAAESTGALVGIGLSVPVAGWIAVAGLVLVFVGYALVETTKDPPIETWLENSWFGTNWESLTITDDPTSPTFLIKDPDGVPRIDRQIAWWFMAFDPIQATAAYSTTGRNLSVTCAPRRARRGSWVTVNLYTFADDVTQSTTILSQAISKVAVGRTRYLATYDTDDNDAVVSWQCTLPLQHLVTRGVSPGTDFSTCWLEVLVSAPIDVLDDADESAFTSNSAKFSFQARDLVPIKAGGA